MRVIKKGLRQILMLLLLMVSIITISSVEVNAAEKSYTMRQGNRITYGNRYILEHYLGDHPAYCLQWTYGTLNGSVYTQYTPTSMTPRMRYIAGYAIELVKQDYPKDDSGDAALRQFYGTSAVNCLFKLSGYKCESYGQKYVDAATAYVDSNYKLCTGANSSGCLNNESFKLSLNSSTMNQIGSTANFISNKVTLNGLLKTYGGDDFGVTYTISASSSSGNTVEICSNANGTGCSGASKTITNTEGNYSFYVKVSNATPTSTVTIKATASNKATYPYGYAYQYMSWAQALMIVEDQTISRSLSRTATLNVPDKTKHTITARKVDENGEDLLGASFEIYRADKDTGEEVKVLKKNANGVATLSYVEEDFTTSDDWFNYKYCLRETAAPSGYVYNQTNELENPLCLAVSKSKGTYCYNEENGEESDLEKCNSHTKKCAEDQGEMLEGTDDCVLNGEILETTEDAKAACEDGYEIDLDNNRCVKKETEDPTTSETEQTSGTSGTEEDEDIESTDIIYTCTLGDMVEDVESGEAKCVIKSCAEGYEYSKDANTCTKTTEASICHSDRSAYNGAENVNMSYCDDQASYTFVTVSGGNIDFVKTNNRNSVTISKVDITGEKELSGAKMKICTTKPDAKLDCDIAIVTRSGQCDEASISAGACTNNSNGTMNVQAQWVSDITSRTIRGLKANQTYYLVETVAPLGYAISQYTEFKISDDGTVTSGSTVVENGKILVKNDLTKITISKQDMATSKELPGAQITICNAGKDENGEYRMSVDQDGNCSVATLSNGEEAKWTSTDKPKEIEGLAAGAYYLVETITPDGYDTAEQILFVINQDGKLTDKDGEPLENNKLIMLDRPIENIPTGDLVIILVVILGTVGLGVGAYYYFKIYKKQNKVKSS